MLLIFAAGAVSVSLPHGHASPEKGRPCPRHILSYVLYEFAAFCRRKEMTWAGRHPRGKRNAPARRPGCPYVGDRPRHGTVCHGTHGMLLPCPGCLCCGAGPFCWPLPFKLTKGPRERRRKKYRRIIGIQLTTDGLDGNGTEACSAAYRMSAIPGNVLRETWRRSERAGTAARPVSCTVLFFRILYCTCSYICLVYISVRTYALFSYIIL